MSASSPNQASRPLFSTWMTTSIGHPLPLEANVADILSGCEGRKRALLYRMADAGTALNGASGARRPPSPLAAQSVDLGQVIGGKIPRRRSDVLRDLLRRARAGDHARDRRARDEPGERKLEQGVVARGREGFELLRQREVLLGEVALAEVGHLGETGAFRHLLPALVFAGEQSARERKVRQESEPVGLRHRNDVALDATHQDRKSVV